MSPASIVISARKPLLHSGGVTRLSGDVEGPIEANVAIDLAPGCAFQPSAVIDEMYAESAETVGLGPASLEQLIGKKRGVFGAEAYHRLLLCPGTGAVLATASAAVVPAKAVTSYAACKLATQIKRSHPRTALEDLPLVDLCREINASMDAEGVQVMVTPDDLRRALSAAAVMQNRAGAGYERALNVIRSGSDAPGVLALHLASMEALGHKCSCKSAAAPAVLPSTPPQRGGCKCKVQPIRLGQGTYG